VEVLQSLLAGFDGSLGPKSGIVTQEKFLAYYSAVSASVVDDEYFELILRNTWHLPGAGNTTCRRLLVTKEDGTQSIEEIEDDIDITKEDLQVRPCTLIFQQKLYQLELRTIKSPFVSCAHRTLSL
jgi:calcyphosin